MCSHRRRSFLALQGTQAKCERHLGDAGMRVGGVENVEKWSFSLWPVLRLNFPSSDSEDGTCWKGPMDGNELSGCAEGMQTFWSFQLPAFASGKWQKNTFVIFRQNAAKFLYRTRPRP